MLHPFIGDGIRVDTDKCGSDKSGTKTYKFSSLGFRSEEFDPGAERHVYVCGCSNTFGVGLDAEETWPARFKRRYARTHSAPVEAVNLLNFARSGASNDYITRTMLMQCARTKPDLAVAYFTHSDRTELFSDRSARPVGRWTDKDPTAESYFRLIDTDPLWLHIAALKNILLFQENMRAREIDCLIVWHSSENLKLHRWADHPVAAGLEALINRKRFCPVSLATLECDTAADDLHAGSKSHLAFAEVLADFYESLR